MQKSSEALTTTNPNNTEKVVYVEMNADDKEQVQGYSHIQLDDIHTLDLPILYYKSTQEAEVIDYYDKSVKAEGKKETDNASNWLRYSI